MKNQAIARAKEIMSLKPVFLDTETTGVNSSAEICEISIIDYDGTVLLDSLIRPINPIPEKLVEFHGISNEMVKDAPTFAQIKKSLDSVLKDRLVIIYNKVFDERMLLQSAKLSGAEWQPLPQVECLMLLYSQFKETKKWLKLVDGASEFNISTDGAHRAQADCIMTLGLLKGMANHG